MGGQAEGNALFQVGKELWWAKPIITECFHTNTFIKTGGGDKGALASSYYSGRVLGCELKSNWTGYIGGLCMNGGWWESLTPFLRKQVRYRHVNQHNIEMKGIYGSGD